MQTGKDSTEPKKGVVKRERRNLCRRRITKAKSGGGKFQEKDLEYMNGI